jgi:succinate dehydrogenase / fumarate reductase cytochrome b subunit
MEPSQRPLSPHLQIYRPQLTSVMSIMHRFAGIALALGALLLVCWIISAAAGPPAFTALQHFLGSWFGLLILFGWSVALFYHLSNGIRHLFWDAGHGFELKTAYASGYAVLAATAVLTVLAWICGSV